MELEILFDYKHENIIGLEGYCNENGEKIIVYEHAANKSLDRRLSNVSLTWIKRLAICIDIARGLAFLHRDAPTNETVIHRDIKSANILLTDNWKAKISDFGLSAITARNQKVNSLVVGTAGYVDPQAEDAGFFTEKSDIYSLGVVLFEILYGQLVVPTRDYDKEDATRILKQIHEEEKLESIVFKDIKEQIAPKSLSAFRAIVSQCLVHERKKRPNAKMVLEQLEKSLAFQEDYEIWGSKLPKDYDEILKLSTYSRTYSTMMKKEICNLLSKGILLQDDKLVGHDATEKLKKTQVMISNSNVDQEVPFPTESEEIFKRSKYYDHEEKLFSLTEVNGKKHLVLSAKAALHNFSNSKLFNSKPSSES
ncbi:receptor-like protein kinase FERONIA, partial [Bidens hawaiensis]|uniref:receptor-like protein kinase FERONIA n=1 Tax=Bidens hawaiensis TaxID=980011 RepID=UPI004049E4B7